MYFTRLESATINEFASFNNEAPEVDADEIDDETAGVWPALLLMGVLLPWLATPGVTAGDSGGDCTFSTDDSASSL